MSENIERAVRSRYGSIALSGLSSEQDGVRAVAEAFGYTPEELASIPAEANMPLVVVYGKIKTNNHLDEWFSN